MGTVVKFQRRPKMRARKRGWKVPRLSSWTGFWIVMAVVMSVLALRQPTNQTEMLATTADLIVGRASVIDGDTIEIHGQRIRLWGVDAPEGRQKCTREGRSWRCGTDSANALAVHLGARTVSCIEKARDRYKRIVAVCDVDGDDVGAWLVRSGWALDYARYSKGEYATEQTEAESSRAGLWQGEFEAPWDWRRS